MAPCLLLIALVATPAPAQRALAPFVTPRAYGARGDGRSDDTAALRAALATGRTVRGVPGDVYLTDGGLVAAAAQQVVDLSGATLRLKGNATAKGILRVTGEGASVTGGNWDLNAAENAVPIDRAFETWAILLAASFTSVDRVHVRSSAGLGVKVAADVSHAAVRNSRIQGAAVLAIFFDGPTIRDAIGNRVEGNMVDLAGNVAASGIGIYSHPPYAFVQRGWFVEGNEVEGPATGATSSSVAITVRGDGGVVRGNVVRGSSMGISVDRTARNRCVIAQNHVSGVNGPIAYGIEVNGGACTVTGNFVEGGLEGITGSVGKASRPGDSLDGLVISGNVLERQGRHAVFFQPREGFTARYLLVSGNSMVPAAGASCVHLVRDCRYAVIEGNVCRGSGSQVVGSRAFFLDSVNSDVLVRGNRLSGFERALALYNPRPVPQERILFEGNEVSSDLPNTAAQLVVLEGAARWGAGVRISDNFTASSSLLRDDILDRGANVLDRLPSGGR